MPHHTEATSGSPVFSIAAAGATLRGGALSVLLMHERGGTVGFGRGGGLRLVFLWGVCSNIGTENRIII
ncbi:MAG: hypothetical protein KKG76_11895 [Euryarchaeota archaeon]|nr:hypothetical protein [Euryarchaeota archaeon]